MSFVMINYHFGFCEKINSWLLYYRVGKLLYGRHRLGMVDRFDCEGEVSN